MPRFTLKSRDYIDTPRGKRDFNEQLFTVIAREYPWMTRVLSFNRDPAWKREIVAALRPCERPACLDLACGTGDLTRLLARRFPLGRVTGIDLTPAMLEQARRHHPLPNVAYRQGDMARTGIASASIDIVTAGYALRNAPRLEAAIAEIARILKPGGELAVLDFSRPDSRPAQHLETWVLHAWGAFWGTLRTGNADAYAYIADSLERFPSRGHLHAMLESAGLRIQLARRRFFGVIEIVIATRTLS